MKMWTDKKGNKLTFKEFIERWKEGIEGITPKQKLKSQIFGTKLQLLGVILGIIVSIIGIKNLWWVGIILLGALIVIGTSYLGLKQQLKIIETFEENITEEVDLDKLFEEEVKGGKE